MQINDIFSFARKYSYYHYSGSTNSFLLLLIICLSCTQIQDETELSINEDVITWLNEPVSEIEQYKLFEIDFMLRKTYSNPYDADEITVDLILTNENQTSFTIPCFFMEKYVDNGSGQHWTSTGESSWKARFTPVLPGDYQYHISIRDSGGSIRTLDKNLSVTDSPDKGFIRRYTHNYLLFDDGSPFFANSFNLCIPPRDKPLDYDYFFRKWKDNRMNYTRLWLAPPWGEYAFALEWTDGQFPTQQGKLGLKKYNQEVAARLDDYLQKAQEYGIYIMFCLGDERELETGIYRGDSLPPNRHFWHANPYNQVNGGPAATPLEFFILDESKALYKNRLRYLIARWGYSTHLMVWEFWNEIDHPKWCQEWTFVDRTVADWHREMGDYIRNNDPFHHLISTSFAHENNQPLIWGLPQMDVVQGHNYGGSENLAVQAIRMTRELKEAFPAKPMFISEYGTDYHGYIREGGAEEIGIHNSIWASALSGATGITHWWWWNTLDENDLYFHYKHLGEFLENIPWLDTETLLMKSNHSDVLTVGLTSGDKAWFWVHNTRNNWENAKFGKKVTPLQEIHLSLQNLAEGNYRIRKYDTYSGGYSPTEFITYKASLDINIDKLEKDVAYFVEKSD